MLTYNTYKTIKSDYSDITAGLSDFNPTEQDLKMMEQLKDQQLDFHQVFGSQAR